MQSAAAASQPAGFVFTRVASRARAIDSLHICAPMEHDVGCHWAQAPVGNAVTSHAPIVVNANARKIFRNLDMMPPVIKSGIVVPVAKLSNTTCRVLQT